MSEHTTNKVLVLGAGAVGVYYGSRLAQAGADVSVIARSDYETLKKRGAYHIKSIESEYDFKPASVFSSVEDAGNDWDLILVALKVLPEIDRVKLLKPVTGKNTAIALIQNGIDIEEEVARAFPNNKIISGLAFICVSRVAPADVWHQDYGHLVIGDYPSGTDHSSKALAALFEKAGVKCGLTDDVRQARWKKLCWNAPYNPISVLAGSVDTRRIMDSPGLRALTENIMREVMSLSIADRHAFDEAHIQSQLEATDKMRPYKPSMLLDYQNHRPLEVDAILGNAVKIADRLGVSIPAIRTMEALLRSVDEEVRLVLPTVS